MTENNSLRNGISRIAWGFVFILFHFKINSIDLLPDFVGYILVAIATGSLAENLGHLKLLRPLSIIIAIWTASVWFTETLTLTSILTAGYMSTVMGYLSTAMGVVILIFTIVLLTDLSVLAAKYQPGDKNIDRRLLVARNIYAVCYSVNLGLSLSVLLTFNNLPELLAGLTAGLSIVMSIAMLITMIIILVSLFSLRKFITEAETNIALGTYNIPPFTGEGAPIHNDTEAPVYENPDNNETE